MWANLYDPFMHDCLPSLRGVYLLEEVEVERGLGVVEEG
jgi:hypothetical protein